MNQIHQNPEINGKRATLYWQGENPPVVAGDFNDWDATAGLKFERASSRLWKVDLDLSEAAYMEYAFFEGEKRILDPLNSNQVNNGVGSRNNYFYMPAARPSPFTRLHPRRGQLTRFNLVDQRGLIHGRRTVYFYRPAVDGPLPLLLVLDGVDYLRRGRILQMVDSLTAAGKIQPVALAMIQNAGQGRFVEYGCSDAFLFTLLGNLIPQAVKQLQLLDPQEHPGSCGILGASMGGTTAVFAGLRAPQVFGKVLAQSGAYSTQWLDFSDFPLIEASKNHPAQFWLDVGEYDFLLQDNRRMAPALEQAGHTVYYSEGSGGHNYTYWRNALPAGLQKLFPPRSSAVQAAPIEVGLKHQGGCSSRPDDLNPYG
jgi:enterochelin esterase family protein